jgi:HEAT repeat protein
MAKLTDEQFFWWESVPAGKPTPLGIVHVDPAGCGPQWSVLSDAEAQYRRTRFHEGVEAIARLVGAAIPPAWQGDQATLLIPDGEEPAPVRAFRATRLLWERARVDLNLTGVRIAAHWAVIPWNPKPEETSDPAVEVCRNLARAAPEDSVAVSDDVVLVLPEALRREVAPLGLTVLDRIPAYVFPAASAARKAPGAFVAGPDFRLWEAFRQYALSAEVSKLRYVGFRLARKEPPALDILDVFVPLEVTRRRRRMLQPRAARHPEEGEDLSRDEVPFAPPGEMEESDRPEPFADAFRESRGVVILGDPGSGKTTLLRWLAVIAGGGRYALHAQLGAGERLLPLPVSVGRLADIRARLGDEDSVVDALASYFHDRHVGQAGELKPFLRRCLEAGECLVLLDGLDEVRSEERQAVRGWLESFAVGFPRNRFVVSSRRVGYGGFDLPTGEEVALRPFNDEQVRRYVQVFNREYRRWETGADDPKRAEQTAADLLRALEENPRLHALARNPFLLSGLALIHRAEGRLPRHRVQFYEIFARCLCDAWGDARRLVAGTTTRDIPYEEEAIPILGNLAFEMHSQFPAGRAPRDFVVRSLKAALQEKQGVPDRQALGAANEFLHRAGDEVQLFLERGPDEWGFLHLTFQEFFAAAWLHAEETFQEFALGHWFEPRWEEVIRLGVGYMALIQKRPAAVRSLIEDLRNARCAARPWVTEILRLQVPFVTLLAAEAGDALPRGPQRQIADDFAAWSLEFETSLAGRVRREVALTDFRDQLAAPYIARLSSDSRPDLSRAAYALGQLRSESALQPLLEALKDPDPVVRWCAASALGQLRSESALPALLEALKDPEASVRLRAASALGQLRPESALPPLLEALKHPDAHVRGRAAGALGELRPESALPPLLEAMKDPAAFVRGSATDALGQLRSNSALQPLLEAMKDPDAFVRWSAAGALGQLRSDSALQPLLEALKDPDPVVRWFAADALGHLRSDSALQPLLEALKDPGISVRVSAASALGQLRSDSALPPLLEALRDPHAYVRVTAAHALGQLRPESAVQPLLEAMKDPEAYVRRRAADALGQLRPEAALQPLLEALKDPDADVRRSAADALIAILASLPPSR